MKSKFDYLVPVLPTANLAEAIAFFESLGFHHEWSWGEPHCYAGMYSDSDHVIHLQQVSEVPAAPAGLYLQVQNVDEIYAECREMGLQVLHPLGDQDYGMRDFSVAGPDGMRVSFGQEMESR